MALPGITNEEKIWNYLRKKGLTAHGAAGMMGNLYAESGLRPNNLQNSYNSRFGMTDEEYTLQVDCRKYTNFVSDKAGYGLAQWTYWSRKQGLLDMATERGCSIGDIEMQLDYMMKELESQYGALLTLLKTTEDVREASDAVLLKYEKPADQSDSVKTKRYEYAILYFEQNSTRPENGPGANAESVTTESKLVSVRDWTTKHSGRRTEPISKITIHHMAGNLTVENCMAYHRKSEIKASANYYIASDGRIGQAVSEKNRAWTSSSAWNDQRAVTIEVANCAGAPDWKISAAAYESLVALCADICRRNGIQSVSYTGTKDGSLTEHRMFAATLCPGPYIHNLLTTKKIENDINAALSAPSAPPDEAEKKEKNPAPYPEPQTLIKHGTKGNSTRWLQYMLNRAGYGLVVDGVAGLKTEAALVHYQWVHGLTIDGICGPATRAALKAG